MDNFIRVKVEVNAPIEKVWHLWNNPEDIMQWNIASTAWETTSVNNDLRAGGRFLYVMGLKDGSTKFKFAGTYDEVNNLKLISYTLDDGRRSEITFTSLSDRLVKITEAFEPEDQMPADMQYDFVNSILLSFKKHAEAKAAY